MGYPMFDQVINKSEISQILAFSRVRVLGSGPLSLTHFFQGVTLPNGTPLILHGYSRRYLQFLSAPAHFYLYLCAFFSLWQA